MSNPAPTQYDAILARKSSAQIRRGAAILLVVILVVGAMSLTGLLDPRRFADA